MELYDSEEQQVEAIKDWWKENGKAVILGAVVGLGGIFGWRYYQDSTIAAQDAASKAYTEAMASITAQGAQASDSAQAFIDANKESQYSVLAALSLAKAQVEAGELDNALTQLEWALANNKDAAAESLIRFRVARIQAEQGEFDSALTSLGKITAESWKGRVAEQRGDILLRQGDKEGAYAAYTEAQQASVAGNQALQMKLDDLAK
ncbi:YfgM family protein [Vibrio sp. SCSIO 43136]|uniref:YfgM family protein n=1 Tax=Vibrio sp. SCSIO 43136 TaxID=2819101 RepID=UPI00207664AB|nr:YfgM family protein [Vibrio sp. SCSIO 43136]USD65801.1 YfgM family protein [Vibrio sp. SCSIO 43136]